MRHRISAARVVDESGSVLRLISEHDPPAKLGDNPSEFDDDRADPHQRCCTMNDTRRHARPIKPCDRPHASARSFWRQTSRRGAWGRRRPRLRLRR